MSDEPGLDGTDKPPPRKRRPAVDNAASRERPGVIRLDQNWLKPVRPGWMRGRVRAITTDSEQGEQGLITTWTYTVHPAKPDPAFTVIMRGLTISRRINEGELIEVRWPDPSVQPVRAARIYLPLGGYWINTFDGRSPSGRQRRREFVRGVLMPIMPLVAIGGIVWLLWRYAGIFN